MAITQLNTADFDYAMMLNVINKSYKGKADITLSAFDTTAAPDVKVGSVWEDNGAIFILETADLTPTGYAGITNSTTFYLYYDESAEVFIYSNTAPTWSDVLQGWYNSNDRAFFSMFKDSGGTLYQRKLKLEQQNNLEINGFIKYKGKSLDLTNIYDSSTGTEDDLFQKLDSFIPNIGDVILLNGSISDSSNVFATGYAQRASANQIQISAGGDTSRILRAIVEGSADTVLGVMAW